MNATTLEKLAAFICGDYFAGPQYRSGSELTRFFERVGFSNFRHDGSTRKWWTLSVLQQLTPNNIEAVILRLANPHEYGNQINTEKAIKDLNEILWLEGKEVELNGITPFLKSIVPDIPKKKVEKALEPLPPPDFLKLQLESGLGDILSKRWIEIQKCVNAEAYLAATILMGSLLEGMLLSVIQKYPQEANLSCTAPKDRQTNRPKKFHEWTLSDMIDVARDCDWIDLDIQKFSHALREYRNIIHPYQHMNLNTSPDNDTTVICWLVVQAAANDLARKL